MDEIWPGTLRWWTLTAQVGPLFSSTRSKYVQVLRASLIHMFCIFNHFHIWSLYVLQFGSQCCSREVHWIFRSFYGAGLGVWRYSVTQVYATLLYSCCHSCCINSSSSRFGFCRVVFLTELQWKSIAHRCWKRYPRVGQEVRIGCEHSGQGDAMQDIQDISRYLCLKYFEDLLFHKRTEQQIGYHRRKENLALQLWNSWSQWVSSLTVTEFVWIVSAGEGIFWCRGHWRFRTRFRMLTLHRVCHSTRSRKHSVHRVWRLSFLHTWNFQNRILTGLPTQCICVQTGSNTFNNRIDAEELLRHTVPEGLQRCCLGCWNYQQASNCRKVPELRHAARCITQYRAVTQSLFLLSKHFQKTIQTDQNSI